MPLFKKNPGLNVFSSFKSTEHSKRIQNTFGEVQTFKRELIKAETAIKVYEKATSEVLKVTDDSMAAFPRVWRKDDNTATSPNAAVLPEEDHAKPAPTTKKLASYPSAKYSSSMQQKLSDEVYTPIESWHKQYQHLKDRIAAVEHVRIEYDSARKDVASAREAQLKHARKTDGKQDGSLQAAEQQADAALATKRAAYVAIEEEVHVELLALAADAQQTLGYVQRALLLVADALADAAESHRAHGADMPIINRQSSGPLLLGVSSPTPGSPVSSPGSSVGTPAAFAASPNSSFKNEGAAATAGDQSALQVAQDAQSYRSTSGRPSPLADGTKAGKFDERAAYEAEAAGATSPAIATTGGGAPAPATPPPTEGVSNLNVSDEGLPSAPQHTAAPGVADSAADYPSAPSGAVKADTSDFDEKRKAFLEEHAAT